MGFAQIKYAALQLPLKQCLNQSIKANSCHRLSFVLRPLSSPLPLTANCGQKRANDRERDREGGRELWLIKYAHKFKSRCPDNSPQLLPILQFPAYPRLLCPSHSLYLTLSLRSTVPRSSHIFHCLTKAAQSRFSSTIPTKKEKKKKRLKVRELLDLGGGRARAKGLQNRFPFKVSTHHNALSLNSHKYLVFSHSSSSSSSLVFSISYCSLSCPKLGRSQGLALLNAI